MSAIKKDPHGNVSESADVVLLLIDVINDLDFPEGNQLLGHALPMARRLASFKQRAKAAGIPAIYVNDNFGRWRSNFQAQIEHCLKVNTRGRAIVELLRPSDDDYFILKPKHSGFYCTALDVLLDYLRARVLILTGLSADICVLFTANDAYQRDYRLCVPRDCVASNTAEENRLALEHMQKVVKADVRSSDQIERSGWQFEQAVAQECRS